MLLTLVAGARPNFMKIAPIIKAIDQAKKEGKNIDYRLVHTGQHYDKKMSGSFFEQLGIPEPDINLESGSGTQAEQTAAIMVRFEKELQNERPDVVLVVGDVTSTMACTISAKKLCVDTVHVEAGIRSGDMTMPEEINRMVTDAICDHYFTTSRTANEHLLKSGTPKERIHFVGNTMIDTLKQNMEFLKQPSIWGENDLKPNEYFLVTLHRPAMVDNPEKLRETLDAILTNTGDYPVVFPIHPRTSKILEKMDFAHDRLLQLGPLPYLEFIYLVKNARCVVTDSGGITEETTVMGVPCMTLRNSTERPETVTIGSNELVGTDPKNLAPFLEKIRRGEWKKSDVPELWDGKAAVRIVNTLTSLYP